MTPDRRDRDSSSSPDNAASAGGVGSNGGICDRLASSSRPTRSPEHRDVNEVSTATPATATAVGSGSRQDQTDEVDAASEEEDQQDDADLIGSLTAKSAEREAFSLDDLRELFRCGAHGAGVLRARGTSADDVRSGAGCSS